MKLPDHLDEGFKNTIRARLASFDARQAVVDDAHHAAVAITIVESGLGADLPGLPDHDRWNPAPALLLTRRSATLRKHAGQWAFPGGRLDPGETPVVTALREMHEEVNVALGEERVLGRLDDFVTRSGFVMTPVVVWGGERLETRANPAEVASVHRIPLSEFLRDDAPQLSDEGNAQPVLRMPVGSDHIERSRYPSGIDCVCIKAGYLSQQVARDGSIFANARTTEKRRRDSRYSAGISGGTNRVCARSSSRRGKKNTVRIATLLQ